MADAHFLVGPTASGKTAVAHYLAERRKMGVLSADSMLVYQGMDIGTAKPSSKERGQVPYYGVDLVEPHETFSVGAYVEHARMAFAEAEQRGLNLIVAGGTGLYVKCLTQGLDEATEADPASRERAAAILENEGVIGLQRALKQADPERFSTLRDPDNPRRLIRALELAWKGEPINRSWQDAKGSPLVGLKLESVALLQRIRERVQSMYDHGLLDEAATLMKIDCPLSDTALHAIGYAEAFAVLEGQLGTKDAMEITVRRTRRLAKRQMTWFRHQAKMEWILVQPEEPVASIAEKVSVCWEKYGRTPLHI